MARTRALQIVAAVVAISMQGLPVRGAAGAGAAVVVPVAGLTWTAAAIPGVSSATVTGDTAGGGSRFYLRYAAGFVAPLHHHSPDHFVTTVTGMLVLIVDGTEHRLAPGSYFALTGKAAHAVRCEGDVDCVMFIDAHGPWDVQPGEATRP